MKKYFVCLIAVILIAIIGFGINVNANSTSALTNDEFVRIHIRANSNEKIDQEVKYVVKNAVVNYLSPKVELLTDIEQCKNIIEAELVSIKNLSDRVLKSNNFPYAANIKLTKEFFPDRSYDDFLLKEGWYDSLIIELGAGQGNNWWCVVFPPLCFVNGKTNDSGKIEYKSKVYEFINKFK